MAQVQTVTGPVEASALGVTLIHEHLVARDEAMLVQFPHVGTAREEPLAAVASAGAEAVAAEWAQKTADLGVETICDPAAMFLGRDVQLMRRVSEQTGMRVVPCTGIYTYDHLPTPLLTRDADQIAEIFVHDITEGIQGTQIKAAFIKVAADEPGITANVDKLHRAAARASIQTGTPIMAHSRPASGTGPKQVDIFEEEGVDLKLVQIAHTGDSADPEYAQALIDRGVYIGMDRFGVEMYLPYDQRIATVLTLLERGHADRMFLSADSCATIDWFPMPILEQMMAAGAARDWVMTMVPGRVLPDLREAGMTPEQEQTMMVSNAARWLTGADLA